MSACREFDAPGRTELLGAVEAFARDRCWRSTFVQAGAVAGTWPPGAEPPTPAALQAARTALVAGGVCRGPEWAACGVTRPLPALVVATPHDADVAGLRDGPLASALAAWLASDPLAHVEASAPALGDAVALLRRFAPTPLPVLLLGETGTGKEILARALHSASGRAGRLVAENCAAFPETLLEAELFGVRRGAFTGADRDRPGRFVEADGGTLFLDEVGDLPPALQAKLLRVLQEQEVRALGAERARRVDVRIVAATHRPLDGAHFRPDLYYRLAGSVVHIPPLRRRMGDLPFLAATLLARIAAEKIGRGRVLDPGALAALCARSFPGNVRELDNALRRAAALSDDAVIGAALVAAPPVLAPEPRENLEACAIRQALLLAGGSKSDAARRLGWTRQRLYRRLASLGLSAVGLG